MHPLGILLVSLVLAVLTAVVLVMLLVPICRLLSRIVVHTVRFIAGTIGDTFRLLGAIVTTAVFIPLVLTSIILGRWSAASHYGLAVQGECRAIGASVYRLIIGNPVRLFGLQALTEGIERRVPEAIAAAPGRDKPRSRAEAFEGYNIVGSLAGGGSGGKLYVAQPDERKAEALRRQGVGNIERVVIKAFSLADGTTLPQIVRESRALDAAKRLGLVFEHSLSDDRFYYVMRYVPGESLGLVTQRLHAESGSQGLDNQRLQTVLGYGANLLSTLRTYHEGGLWHKDVKPDNIIVDGKHAQLVDLGLVTPLRSAMTLTTHGTEYFRDPEMVRMALRGVKVHQVNGAKFDVYAAGAVLYAMVENSFPAHGGLSQITKRCPEALRWIVRRAMTDYNRRYANVAEMEADLAVLLSAKDPFSVRPADLPSVSGNPADTHTPDPAPDPAPAHEPTPQTDAHAHTPQHAPGPPPPPPPPPGARPDWSRNPRHARPGPTPRPGPGSRPKPRIRLANWWTGRMATPRAHSADAPGHFDVVDPLDDRGLGVARVHRAGSPGSPGHEARRAARASAKEQVAAARARAEEIRARARETRARADQFRHQTHQRHAHAHANAASPPASPHAPRRQPPAPASFNAGIALSILVFVAVAGLLAGGVFFRPGPFQRADTSATVAPSSNAPSSNAPGTPQPASSNAASDANPNPSPDDAAQLAATESVRLLEKIPGPAENRHTPTLLLQDGSGLVGIGPAGLVARSAAAAGTGRFELLVDGTALILNDLRAPIADPVRTSVGEVAGRLRAVGFRLTEAADDSAQASNWAASLHHVRRLRPLTAPEVHADVVGWIAREPAVDVVVWIESGDSPAQPRYHLFVPDPEPGDVSAQARRLMRNFAAALAVHGPDAHNHTNTPALPGGLPLSTPSP